MGMSVRRTLALMVILLAGSLLCPGANLKLYMKDGSYQLVRDYQVQADRVRYYSVERGEWEEIPLGLVDLDRTSAEARERQAVIDKEVKVFTAEEQAQRARDEEIMRVPHGPGVYLLEGGQLRPLKQAEAKTVTNKGRAVLKILSPLPVVPGETIVELDGGRSAQTVSTAKPEFYFRLARDERALLFKLVSKRDSRVLQRWNVHPLGKEIVEIQEEVPVFIRQVEDGLIMIWPREELKPGEYAVVEYTAGERNIQAWDFGYYVELKP
jgi:hypothetical protein